MKIKKLALVVLFLASNFALRAQDYAFKVLVNKGKNEVKAGNDWQPIKTGTSLKSSDEVKLVDNAYLGLIHATGKPLEVKQAGKYKVVDLAARISGGTSVLNKYTDFILSSNAQKKDRLTATGAVHRGAQNIEVYLPDTKSVVVYIYSNKITFGWDKSKGAGPYVVLFKSMFGDELDKIEAPENYASVDLGGANFVNEDNIIVQVYPKKDPNKLSDDYTLRKLSKADKERIMTSLGEIAPQTNEENALNKLILAGFFEQNNLLIDAGSAYLEAIKLAPDVVAYQDGYEEFLLRNNLKKPTK
ncbi:MAG: hypothetical protein ACOYXT_01500 [Bacteroidota bacterium]